MSILTRIDDLIQRINQVEVCQDHLNLIANSLSRLRYDLNKNITRNIEQILNEIDEVVTSSSNQNAELEFVLLRLHLRLAEYETNFTDNYQTKVTILNNAYHQQQILIQKVLDDKIRSRLVNIEQQTNANRVEQFHILRRKHANTIESYLRYCINLHYSVPLMGVDKNSIAKVAKYFYKISDRERNPTEYNWQIHEIPLTRSFLQLRTDKSTSFERSASRRLLIEQNSPNEIWQRLVSAPYMLSNVERNRCVTEENINEEDILRTKRWIVILGDPGSGKTSFVRWLVAHLARKLRSNEQYSTNFCPLRIPILIRIGEFADVLRSQPSLSLFDYIGQHKWMGKMIVDETSISLDDLSNALQDYIKQGQALIIFDGLDEIYDTNQRSKLINLVENFVEMYVPTPAGNSAIDHPHLSRLFDDPFRSGGNQLIVTSRIVGYHFAPLSGQFAHFIIQPMNMQYIRDFVDYWFSNVHQQLLDRLQLPMDDQWMDHCEKLKEELEKSDHFELRDMTSNSCLLSFICSVAFQQTKGASFPTQRIHLYEQLVNAMLSLWTNNGLTIHSSKLIELLSNIAMYIHQNSASGLIHEEQMKEICMKTFDENPIDVIEKQTTEIRRSFRENIGILVARGESLYGFLHLSFQEYFICLKLIDSNQLKQQNRICSQFLRPRFRVPIALALGKISSNWSKEHLDDFCQEFIQESNISKSIFPLGVYTLIICINDFVNYPSTNVLFNAMDQLIIASGQYQWSLVCPFLIDQIIIVLKKLRNNIVSEWLNHFLSRSPPHSNQTLSALGYFLAKESTNFTWLNESSCQMLQSLARFDNEFLIDRLLMKIIDTNPRLFSSHPNTLQRFLLDQNIQSHSIPMLLLPLIIILYGGLKRHEQTIVFDPLYIYRESTTVTPILIEFFSTIDQNLMVIKEECLKTLRKRLEQHDESSEIIDLCIAIICLSGMENVQIISNSLLIKTLNRLKYISMILREFYTSDDEIGRSIINETKQFLGNRTEKMNEVSNKRKFLELLHSLRTNIARLGSSNIDQQLTLYLPNSLGKESQFFTEFNSHPILFYFIELFWIFESDHISHTRYRMAFAMDHIPEYLLFHHDDDLFFSLIFIPQHLRNLYQELIILISKNNEYLNFGHILLECLMFLSNRSCNRLSRLAALIALLPRLRIYRLENFASSLLWTLNPKDSYLLRAFENARQRPITDQMKDFPTIEHMSDEVRRKLIDECIEQEYQRLENALTENDERDMKLYSASISLAYICTWSKEHNRLFEFSIQGAISIDSKFIRLDALCAIAYYSQSDYNQIIVGIRSLQNEIEYQLNEIYTNLPLLLHTAIFIRCLPLLQSRDLIDNCRENLYEKLTDACQRDQDVIYEALQSSSTNVRKQKIRSSILKEYLTDDQYENVSPSLLLPSMYLVELTSELNEYINSFTTTNCQLTVGQALTITNVLFTDFSSNRSISDALHRFHIVELKACRLLEYWMKWKDSNEFSSFAYHAALILAKSNLWSVQVATTICDLLGNENDRFRQRAEMILRSTINNNYRTSSQLGIDVLLILAKRMAHYQHTSSSAAVILDKMFQNTVIDNRSHLETILWLERYRIHALINKGYSVNKFVSSSISHVVSYFPTDHTIDVSFCESITNISVDLKQYLCELITSQFSSFVEIDGEKTSTSILESHTQFIVSTIVFLFALVKYNGEIQSITNKTLMKLFENSTNNEIRRAAIYALSYISDKQTYKLIFNQLQITIDNAVNESDDMISTFISSYCHCMAIQNIEFDQDDIDLFRKLLKYPSSSVIKAAHVGLGRVLKNTSMLYEMLNFNYIQCYHALIESTAYLWAHRAWQSSAEAVANFIETHPDLLAIFVMQLYNSIRHFTNDILYDKTTNTLLEYGHPCYVEIASLVIVRIPAAFCAYIKDCDYGDNLKRALYYTSKQLDFTQRAACLTILSVFGELTIELCEMFIEALRDDPHIQNICYKSMTRIESIKDENVIIDCLLSYLKSKSMNVRYVTIKMLLHLAQSSLISSDQVRLILNELMLDPSSTEDLWLIEEQDEIDADCEYYYAGPIKDVIYCLLIKYLTGDTIETIRRNQLNDIDSDFVESERVSRLTSCLYEAKTAENADMKQQSKPTYFLDNDDDDDSLSTSDESDEEKSSGNEKPFSEAAVQTPVEKVTIETDQSSTDNESDEEKASEDDNVEKTRVLTVISDISPPCASSKATVPVNTKFTICIIL